jgi:hypothetical protein
MEERGERLNLLEIPLPSGIDSQGYMNKDYLVRLGSGEALVQLPDAVHLFDEVPGEEIYATRIEPRHLLTDNVLEEYRYLVGLGEQENALVGFHREEGNGSLTYLGVPPSAELVLELHRYLGVPIPALPLTPGIQASLFERGDTHYLIVLNSGWEPKAADILLDSNRFPGDRVVLRDFLRGGEKETVFPANADMKTITVNSDGRNGAFYELKVD